MKGANAEERIKIALFLLQDEDWKDVFEDAWLLMCNKTLEERIAFVEARYKQSIASIFPWQQALSDTIDRRLFTLSHLHQPDLFIRVRPGKEDIVKNKLMKANIAYKEVNANCLAFNNATKLDDVLELNKEYVVQDRSSQQVGQLLSSINCQPSVKVWDCCAASGGKAIMAYDIIPSIDLTVSDIRPSIIHNLRTRFQQAGITMYKSFIADLSSPKSPGPKGSRETYQPFNLSTDQLPSQINQLYYDLIICDAPCSGSGTWSRTPEQLYFFKEEEIRRYSDLQKRIVSNVLPFLTKGGHLLYITCSVFKKENEDVVEFINEQFNLTMVDMQMIKGYESRADTMFAALFKL